MYAGGATIITGVHWTIGIFLNSLNENFFASRWKGASFLVTIFPPGLVGMVFCCSTHPLQGSKCCTFRYALLHKTVVMHGWFVTFLSVWTSLAVLLWSLSLTKHLLSETCRSLDFCVLSHHSAFVPNSCIGVGIIRFYSPLPLHFPHSHRRNTPHFA